MLTRYANEDNDQAMATPPTKQVCKWFLTNEHPSSTFMSALGVRTSTLHEWAHRGYLIFPKTGKGRTLYLSASELLMARALNIISKSGGTPKLFRLEELRNIINIFLSEILNCCTNEKDFPAKIAYFGYKYSDKEDLQMTWILYDTEEFFQKLFPNTPFQDPEDDSENHEFYFTLNLNFILYNTARIVWKHAHA